MTVKRQQCHLSHRENISWRVDWLDPLFWAKAIIITLSAEMSRMNCVLAWVYKNLMWMCNVHVYSPYYKNNTTCVSE